MKHSYYITAIVVVALGSFFVGNWYGTSKSTSQNNQAGRNFGQFAGANRTGVTGQAGGANRVNRPNNLRGEILSKDTSTLTLKLDNGGSSIIFYATSTPVSKMATGSITDLQVGQKIMAMGIANTDGSITANSLQLLPPSSTPRFNNLP